MDFSFKEFLNIFKLPPNILAVLSFSTGIILFVPNKVLSKMYLIDFRDNYGFIIGMIFLISISMLFMFFIVFIFRKIFEKIKEIRLRKSREKYLLKANQNTVNLIRSFIEDDTHTLTLSMNDGLIVELEYYSLISVTRSTQLCDTDFDNNIYVKYFLQPWVVDLIKNNEELRNKYGL